MAKVQVGGKDYVIQPLVFATLEKVWPHIDAIQQSIRRAQQGQPDESPVPIMAAGVACLALSLAQDNEDFQAPYSDPANAGLTEAEKDQLVINKVKRLITSKETQALEPVINEIMLEAGFKAEQPGEQGASPSTATGMPSSQNSSPQVSKEEAGTE